MSERNFWGQTNYGYAVKHVFGMRKHWDALICTIIKYGYIIFVFGFGNTGVSSFDQLLWEPPVYLHTRLSSLRRDDLPLNCR